MKYGGPRAIVAWMVLAIGLLGALAYADEQRAAAEALDDFAREQIAVARGAAAALEAAPPPATEPEARVRGVVARLTPIAEPGRVVVLVRPPASDDLFATDGRRAVSQPIRDALASASSPTYLRLGHDASAALGLPPRTSMAGVAHAGRWGVAVVATAQRERDREIRAARRVVVGFVLASALVLGFGLLALRKQRRELALEHRLALEIAERDHDERLARAGKLASLGALGIRVAHELATPLAVIAGRAEQLVHPDASPRVTRAARIIAEQADAIGKTMRGFLSFVRGDPRLVDVVPGDVARVASEMVAHRVKRAGGELVVDVADGLPSFACDRYLVEQAVVGMLLNACESIAAGGRVALTVASSPGSVLFDVAHDAPAAAGVDAPASAAWQGSGRALDDATLGVLVAHEVAQHHGGSFRIERRPPGVHACLSFPAAHRPS